MAPRHGPEEGRSDQAEAEAQTQSYNHIENAIALTRQTLNLRFLSKSEDTIGNKMTVNKIIGKIPYDLEKRLPESYRPASKKSADQGFKTARRILLQ